MAQQTTVELIDDLDGTKGSETIRFGIDGVHLEIDLNTKNAKALRKAVAEYVAAARTVQGVRYRRRTGHGPADPHSGHSAGHPGCPQ